MPCRRPAPRRRPGRHAITMAAVASLATPALAAPQSRVYLGPSGGNWSFTGNWNPSGAPVAGDSATISVAPSGASPFTVNFNATNLSDAGRLESVLLNSATAPLIFNHTLTTAGLFANNLTLASTGNATYSQTAGTHSVSSVLALASAAGSSATYSLSGSGTLVAYDERVGEAGRATFLQSGGTHNATALQLGRSSAGTGIYTLTGGTLTTQATIVADAGTATFSHSAGTHNATNFLFVGAASGSTGHYSLSDSASLTGNVTQIGVAGTGSFNQSGGSHTVTGTLTLGLNPAGRGSYALSAGPLSVGANLALGHAGQGTLTQSGGSLSVANTLQLGRNANSAGHLTLSDGSLSAHRAIVGESGTGSVTQTGGTLSLSEHLHVATATGSQGAYALSGGTLRITRTAYVGGSGAGTFTHTGGTLTSDEVTLGSGLGGTGTYFLSATGQLRTDDIFVGITSPGSFTQSGGTAAPAHLLIGVFANAAGAYTLTGGSLNLTPQPGNTQTRLVIGDGGSGTFTQTGGSVSVPGTLSVAAGAGRTSSYSLTAGTLSVTPAPGQSPARGVAVGGTEDPFNDRLLPGEGTARLTIAGTASVTIASPLRVLPVADSSLTLAGGSLTVASLDLSNDPSRFNWTAGTLGFTAPYTLDASLFPAGLLTLTPSKTLATHATGTNHGTILLAGGTLDGPGTLTNHSLLTGHGVIVSNLVNLATLAPAPNTTLVLGGTLTNAANLSLPGSAIEGPGTLVNTGILSGTGLIATPLINSGTLLVGSGPLALTAPLTNTPAGTILLGASSSLYLSSTPTAEIRELLRTQNLTHATPDPSDLLSLAYQPTPGATLIQLTLTGDANLDGAINADDYALLDRGLATNGQYWWQGDFNYDGQVNEQDYLLIDRTYLLTKAQGWQSLGSPFLSMRESQFGPAYVQQLLTTVPEPATPLACLFATSLLTRRRRRNPSPKIATT